MRGQLEARIPPQAPSDRVYTGGETGIRTQETLTRLHALQACSFDHSDTSPQNRSSAARDRGCKRLTTFQIVCCGRSCICSQRAEEAPEKLGGLIGQHPALHADSMVQTLNARQV